MDGQMNDATDKSVDLQVGGLTVWMIDANNNGQTKWLLKGLIGWEKHSSLLSFKSSEEEKFNVGLCTVKEAVS